LDELKSITSQGLPPPRGNDAEKRGSLAGKCIAQVFAPEDIQIPMKSHFVFHVRSIDGGSQQN
jgi:hypothetical protein